MLHRDQFKACLALSSQPSLRNSALAGVQAAIALPLIWLSPWSHLIGFAALGALVALFGRFAPSESRSRIILSSAILQVLAVFTMSAAAWMGASTAAQLALLRSFAVCSCASP